jgi:hypothetical protein
MNKILIDEAIESLLAEYDMVNSAFAKDLRKALADAALDKMAENARELGLSYEPAHCEAGPEYCPQCEVEQPAQQSAERGEPVATKLHEAKQNFERNFGPHDVADWIYSDLLEWLGDTTPPAPAQPLTDEQRQKIHNETGAGLALIRLVESYLAKGNT